VTVTETATQANIYTESEGVSVCGLNDSIAGAESVQTTPITISQIINGHLSAAATCAGGDVDYYKIPIGITGTWTFWLDCFDRNQALTLGVYNSVPTALATVTIVPPSAGNVQVALSSGQTIYVMVSGGTGPYSVKILHP
jgi:hypothetical protein